MIKVKMRIFLGAVIILLVLLGTTSSSIAQTPQITQSNPLTEADAFKAVSLAANPTARLAAAEDFVTKFPKSDSRLKVVELVVSELRKVRNPTVAITLLERARSIFTLSEELEILKPISLAAYAGANHSDEAFELAAELLKSDPEDLEVLTQMIRTGADEARKRDHKHVELALGYGLKAIALIESGNKPAKIDNETWTRYQASLSQLYQEMAILYLAINNSGEAKTRLTKASNLEPRDPANFALLGRLLNAEYVAEVARFESMPEGNGRQELRKKLDGELDAIIDLYARAIGLATGRPEYQSLMQQLVPDLTSYYRQRHSQSTEGLQKLINKYRVRQ